MEFLNYFIGFLFFFFGAIMGSFLNVIALELEPVVFEKEDGKIFWKRINRRSQCPSCGYQLKWWELVPLFSFIFLKGKCFHCKAKISWRYFWVEIFSGVLFFLFFWKFFNLYKFSGEFFFYAFFFTLILSGLILIFLFDQKHKIIPDEVYIPTLIISLIFVLLKPDFHWMIFIKALIAASPFFLLWYLSKGKWIGYADWKLVFLLSLFFEKAIEIYSFLTLSFWVGGGIILLKFLWERKYQMGIEVAFGPFLILGWILVLIFNLNVLDLVNNLIY